MILQYCLSIHAINFFTFPSFSNFKIRLINQQNGDCNDNGMLDPRLLNSNTFPVQIKLKGSERLLMKVKVIAFKSKQVEIVIGEGVVNIDKNAIDNSIRVPIYDKKQGVEEVAICSVDFFVSGNPIEKNASITLDKSKSKIDDWRDHTQDAAYSQMSFTVQSQNQQQEIDLPPKANSLPKSKLTKDKETLPKNKKRLQSSFNSQVSNLQIKPITSNKASNIKKIQYPLQPQSPLQNSAYLSQTPSKIKKPQSTKNNGEDKRQNEKNSAKAIAQQIRKQNKRQQGKRIVFQSNPSVISQSKQQQDKTIDGEQLRKKLKQQQKIAKQLKKYLAKHKSREKDYSTDFKVQKQKVRRTHLKVQEISSYKSQANYLKYFYSPKQSQRLIMMNVKAYKITQNQLKEDFNDELVQVPVNNFKLTFVNNQKIVTFDSLGYRAYCIANYIKEYPIEIIIPQIEQSLKVKLQLNNCGSFQGTIGVQQGQKMAVMLKLRQKNETQVLSALRNYSYKLCFDIKRNSQMKTAKDSQKHERNDISFRQPIQLNSPQSDIRNRIQSLNIQPWGYGYSYLDKKSPYEADFLAKIKEKKKAIQSEAKLTQEQKLKNVLYKNVLNKSQAQKNKDNKKNESSSSNLDTFNSQKAQQIKRAQVNRNEFEKSRKKKIIKSEQKQKLKQSSDEANFIKNEINQIKNIRNGNRNNYKFTAEKEQKKATVKQMWEKLLIKKKVQEEQLAEMQRARSKQINRNQKFYKNKSKEFQTSLDDSDESPVKSKLYSMMPGANRVQSVNNSENQLHQSKSIVPLRSLKLQINNISITQPLAIISEQLGEMSGKFIKLQIKDKITYYTQIIFNGEFNSILWKLSGCIFNDLLGNEILDVQIYKTVENKITMLGKTSIRVSKLYFLRNNHIYNGKIIYKKILNGQFTLGFEVDQNIPFQIIEEEEEEPQFNRLPPSINRQNFKIRQSENLKNPLKLKNETRNYGKPSFSQGKDEKSSDDSLIFQSNDKVGLKDTLRKNNRKRNKFNNNSLEVEAISELQESNFMPGGLILDTKMHRN